jgi:hypothetical protein
MKENLFRRLTLPVEIPGRVYLHSMPGRYEPMTMFLDELIAEEISTIICLTGPEEILLKSPEYLQALQAKSFPCSHRMYDAFPDRGIPSDFSAFCQWVSLVVQALERGDRLLLHCAGGVGRTGTFAACVRIAFGSAVPEAFEAVRAAGSFPDTLAQKALVSDFAQKKGQL